MPTIDTAGVQVKRAVDPAQFRHHVVTVDDVGNLVLQSLGGATASSSFEGAGINRCEAQSRRTGFPERV